MRSPHGTETSQVLAERGHVVQVQVQVHVLQTKHFRMTWYISHVSNDLCTLAGLASSCRHDGLRITPTTCMWWRAGAQVQVHVLQAEEEADDLVASLQEALQDHIASLGPSTADSRCRRRAPRP